MDDPQPAAGRSLTLRAVVIGLGLCLLIAIATPINDWYLHNTAFYNNQNPVIVTVVVLLLAAVVNPLLGRRRLVTGELAVITMLVLVIGGVVSAGLDRHLPAMVAGGSQVLADRPELQPLQRGEVEHDGHWDVPRELFIGIPEQGPIDETSPAHRQVTTGYLQGLEDDQPIPWSAWFAPALAWLPLIAAAGVAVLALCAVVRHQWIEHERLPYPLAMVLLRYLEPPEPGRRLPPILRSTGFRIGFGATLALLCWKGLGQVGWIPIQLPLKFDLWLLFTGEPWNWAYNWWWLFNAKIFFSVIAVTFFLPRDLSFSLWAGFVGLNLLYILGRGAGIPLERGYAGEAATGGCVVYALLILWVGRQAYLGILRAAFVPGGEHDPVHRAAAPFARLLLLSAALAVAVLVGYGAPVGHALLAVVLFLGISLVLARIVAEAGVPFFSWPGPHLNSLMVGTLGFGAPPAALIAATALGISLMNDYRESLACYATQAEFIGNHAGVPRKRGLTLMAVALLVAAGVAGATMLVIAYRGGGHGDWVWDKSLLSKSFGLVAGGIDPVQPQQGLGWGAMAVGGALTAAVGCLRLWFAGFPFHPLGLLVAPTYATGVLWFSFLLGWLVKSAVMRYGGVALYRTLIPVAIGVIAGEAIATLLFTLIRFLMMSLGTDLSGTPDFMPA